MSLKVKGNLKAFETFSNELLSNEFKELLKNAIKNPEGHEANMVLKKIMPVLEFAGGNTLGGAVETNKLVSQIYALSQHFMSGCTFYTIAPDDINNPTSFRLCFCLKNNKSFPASEPDEDFIEKMVSNSTFIEEGEIPIPVGYSDRAKAAAMNPIATSIEYKNLIENVLNILIGIKTFTQKKQSMYYLQEEKGIFGNISAGIGVTETQGRLSLHFHAILFGGINPKLLQRVSCMDDICSTVGKVLDSMYSAELPKHKHIYSLIKKNVMFQRNSYHPPIFRAWKKEKTNIQELDQISDELACSFIHSHSFTCKKGPSGKHGCRMAKPNGLRNTTRPVELDKKSIDQDVPEVLDNITEPSTNLFSPIKEPDNRVIVWELKRNEIEQLPEIPEDNENKKEWMLNVLKDNLTNDEWNFSKEKLSNLKEKELDRLYKKIMSELPKRNGYVVEHNKLGSALLGCNTCAMPLGDIIQSKSCLFYLSPYVSKNKVELQHAVSTLSEAKKHVDKYASIAEDSGTEIRNVQHWLTRTLNSLDSMMEIADTQAAAALLDMKTVQCSESFQIVGIHQAYKFIQYLRSSKNKKITHEIVDQNENDSEIENSYIHSSNNDWGYSKIYKIKEGDDGKDTPVWCLCQKIMSIEEKILIS